MVKVKQESYFGRQITREELAQLQASSDRADKVEERIRQAEAEIRQAEAEIRQAKAETRQAKAETRQAEVKTKIVMLLSMGLSVDDISVKTEIPAPQVADIIQNLRSEIALI